MSDNLFEGISTQRLLGAMLQGINLANLSTSMKKRPQPIYRPPGSPLPEFSQEEWNRARAAQTQADRELVTNDKGQVVPVEFPAND